MAARVLNASRPRSGKQALLISLNDLLPLLPVSALQRLENAARAELSPATAAGAHASLNLSIQELRLVKSFRQLPEDQRRDSVLNAMELFSQAYI
jgi:hypothetical protein